MLPPAFSKAFAAAAKGVDAIVAEEAAEQREHGQEWIATYTAPGEALAPVPPNLATWLRAQTPAMQEALVRFPPGCVVVRDAPADDAGPLPAEGVACILMSVLPDAARASFRSHPHGAAIVQGGIAGLRVVGYRNGLDGAAVRAAIDAPTADLKETT